MLRDERRDRCPYCDQLMVHHRLGVSLGPIKARLFDLLKRAGADGIDGPTLYEAVMATRNCKSGMNILRTHIMQMNDKLEDTGVRIISSPRGLYARYRLKRVSSSIQRYDRSATRSVGKGQAVTGDKPHGGRLRPELG
jgi:hypothetical protein